MATGGGSTSGNGKMSIEEKLNKAQAYPDTVLSLVPLVPILLFYFRPDQS